MKFERSEKFDLKASIDYSTGGIVSKQIVRNRAGNYTLFAFDRGQFLSEHISDFDSVVQIIEGEAKVFIDEREIRLIEGEAIIMPAHIPHELKAEQQFKMILITIKDL